MDYERWHGEIIRNRGVGIALIRERGNREIYLHMGVGDASAQAGGLESQSVKKKGKTEGIRGC